MRYLNILFVAFVISLSLINILIFFSPNDFEKKEEKNLESPCNFIPNRPPCSTKRDAVLFYGTNSHAGLFLAIKSLRATGAKCRIVVLGPTGINLSQEFLEFAETYDIEIYDHCDNKHEGDTVPHMLRYEYESLWIKKHLNELDRVIHSDGYDVFFQSDPFVAFNDKQGLTFIAENVKIYQCEWNSNWVIDCYNTTLFHTIESQPIICSGVILGTAVDYLRFALFMINRPEWLRCWGNSNDQPIVNYLVYSGLLKDIGLNYDIVSCNSDILNMQWCLFGKSVKKSEKGHVLSPNNQNTPALLHQYNRFKDLMQDFGGMCNISFQMK